MGLLLSNNFVIAVCEVIKNKGYSKDPRHNIVVVEEEDDIIIRYLFVIRSGFSPLGIVDSTELGFEKHYQK